MWDSVLTLSFVMFYSAGGVIVAGNGGRTVCNNTPEARLAILEEDVSRDFSYLNCFFWDEYMSMAANTSLFFWCTHRCFPISGTCCLGSPPTASSSTRDLQNVHIVNKTPLPRYQRRRKKEKRRINTMAALGSLLWTRVAMGSTQK